MGQTAVRKLQSCMHRPPRCGLHNGPPRAALADRYMPAPRTRPKPPEAHEGSAELLALGFRVADSGPHTSKTLMLQELEALLAAVPADAPAKAYRAAMLEENVLGKGTRCTRKETASPPTALHGLDLTKPLFRVLRRLWDVDPSTLLQLASYSQLACGCDCVWGLPPASVVTPTSEEEG